MRKKASTEREIAPAITGNYGKQPDNSDTNAGPMLIAEIASRKSPVGNREAVMTLAIRGRGDDCNLEIRTDGLANAILMPGGGRGGVGCGAIAHSLKAEGFDASEGGTGRGVPLVPEVCSTVSSKWAKSSDGPSGDECQNLVAEKNGDGHRPPLQPIAFSSKDHGADAADNLSPTLRASGHDESHANAGAPPAIAFPARMSGTQRATSENVSSAIGAANPTGVAQGNNGDKQDACPTMAVRRLTPRECERLQGFPDDFTLVQFNGKPACDGPRYKAIGNSMAVPNIEWIGRRMDLVDELVPLKIVERAEVES